MNYHDLLVLIPNFYSPAGNVSRAMGGIEFSSESIGEVGVELEIQLPEICLQYQPSFSRFQIVINLPLSLFSYVD